MSLHQNESTFDVTGCVSSTLGTIILELLAGILERFKKQGYFKSCCYCMGPIKCDVYYHPLELEKNRTLLVVRERYRHRLTLS